MNNLFQILFVGQAITLYTTAAQDAPPGLDFTALLGQAFKFFQSTGADLRAPKVLSNLLGGIAGDDEMMPYYLEGLSSYNALPAFTRETFKNKPSCFRENTFDAQTSTILKADVKNLLIDCDKRDLRLKVDTATGCMLLQPGEIGIWTRPPFITNTKIRGNNDWPVDSKDIRWVCDQNKEIKSIDPTKTKNRDINTGTLNAVKTMCQKLHKMVGEKCNLCQLKVLVDEMRFWTLSAPSSRIRTCAVKEFMTTPSTNVQTGIDTCIARYASNLRPPEC